MAFPSVGSSNKGGQPKPNAARPRPKGNFNQGKSFGGQNRRQQQPAAGADGEDRTSNYDYYVKAVIGKKEDGKKNEYSETFAFAYINENGSIGISVRDGTELPEGSRLMLFPNGFKAQQ